MSGQEKISVSQLKATLLQIMRNVIAGRSYEVTRSNIPIAVIYPIGVNRHTPATGFSHVKIGGALDLPGDLEWSLDAHNLKSANENRT